jgi:hypothetical protein
MSCSYCQNIFGVKEHNIENCYALKLHSVNMMFCWHCHHINEKNNFKNMIVHWHKTQNCPHLCKNNNCHMKNINHSVNDCIEIIE